MKSLQIMIKHVSRWFKPALDEAAAKAQFIHWNGYFDQEQFESWVEDKRHPKQTLFPNGLVRCELSSFEAQELISLLRLAIADGTVLSSEHIHYEVLPNFLRCEFVNGRINGEIILTVKDFKDPSGWEGRLFRGHFQDGIPHGRFQVYDLAERISEEYELSYGIKHGRCALYDEGTLIESTDYRYNERHGRRVRYHRSGRLKTVSNYEHDKRIGPQQYFEDKD